MAAPVGRVGHVQKRPGQTSRAKGLGHGLTEKGFPVHVG
jgi:hypothetical protein